MKKEDINKFLDALSLKKDEFKRYVDEQVKNIHYPEDQLPVERVDKTNSSPNIGYLSLGGGLLLTAVGLFKNPGAAANILTVGGVLMTIASIYSIKKQKDQKPTTPQQTPSLDLYVVTEKINNTVKSIHTHVSDGWSDFLSGNQKQLASLIEKSELEVEKRNKLIEQAYKKTVIQYSMLDVLSDLSNIEREKNIDLYKNYVNSFCKKYKDVIESAYIEQKAYLEDMTQYFD